MRFLFALPLVLVGWTSCVPVDETTRPNRFEREKILSEWHDDGGEGKVSVRISLTDQIAEFERGGRFIGWCYVATGKEGHSTRDGVYPIMEKIEDKYSNKYGWIEDEFGNVVDGDAKVGDKVGEGMIYVPAPMPFWMRLTSYGIGMHGGLIPEPGKPASHGCIRMPKDFVPKAFSAVKVGTPVTITHAPSEIGKQRAMVLNHPTLAVRQQTVLPPLDPLMR
jgi:L,D-transpeptidase catalytic domain